MPIKKTTKKVAGVTKNAKSTSAEKSQAAKTAEASKTTAKKTSTKKAEDKTFSGAATSGKTLVIVESPSKAKTLSKILGPKYVIKSSIGHIRDLPRSRMAIDIENDFAPEYILVKGKAVIKNELAALSQNATSVLLASDPDREGEAIAWHLAELLAVPVNNRCRVRFYEITENAVRDAVAHPDFIDRHKVDAQQARRILDRQLGTLFLRFYGTKYVTAYQLGESSL